MDVGYTSHKIDDGEGNANSVAKRTIVGSNGLSTSRLGFRGTEDIGNGTKAGFTFELGLAPAGGTPSAVNGAQPISAVDNRQAFVTLSNAKLGTVNVGRQYTHAHAIQAGYNAGGTNNVVGDATYSQIEATPLGTNLTGPTNGISGLRADALNSAVYQLRASNAVSYMLPTLAQGLTLGVSMSTVNTANNGTDVGTKGTSLMAKYETGPLSLGFSHAKGTTKAAGGTTADGAGGAFNGAVQGRYQSY